MVEGEGFRRVRLAHGAEFQFAVMAEHKVAQMLLKARLEAGAGEKGREHLHAEHEVPEQPPLGGVVIGEAAGKFANLAEIMDVRELEQGLAVQLRVLVLEASAELYQP